MSTKSGGAYAHIRVLQVHCRMQNLFFYCVLIHVITKCKNIFTKMLKDVGMEVPESIETRSKFSMHADKGRG